MPTKAACESLEIKICSDRVLSLKSINHLLVQKKLDEVLETLHRIRCGWWPIGILVVYASAINGTLFTDDPAGSRAIITAPIFDHHWSHPVLQLITQMSLFNSKYPCLITTTSLDGRTWTSSVYLVKLGPSNPSKLDGTTKNSRCYQTLLGFFGLERREIEAKAGDLDCYLWYGRYLRGEPSHRQTQLSPTFTSMSHRFNVTFLINNHPICWSRREAVTLVSRRTLASGIANRRLLVLTQLTHLINGQFQDGELHSCLSWSKPCREGYELQVISLQKLLSWNWWCPRSFERVQIDTPERIPRI